MAILYILNSGVLVSEKVNFGQSFALNSRSPVTVIKWNPGDTIWERQCLWKIIMTALSIGVVLNFSTLVEKLLTSTSRHVQSIQFLIFIFFRHIFYFSVLAEKIRSCRLDLYIGIFKTFKFFWNIWAFFPVKYLNSYIFHNYSIQIKIIFKFVRYYGKKSWRPNKNE